MIAAEDLGYKIELRLDTIALLADAMDAARRGIDPRM